MGRHGGGERCSPPCRCSLPLPFHRAVHLTVDQAATRPLCRASRWPKIGDLPATDFGRGICGGVCPQASPRLRVGEARIAQVRARISPRPSKAVGGVGAGITAVGAAGRFRPHLSPCSRRRTHTEHSTLDRHTPGIGRARSPCVVRGMSPGSFHEQWCRGFPFTEKRE